MAAIVASIRRGFVNVLRFSGRDSPGQFWPYALFVILLDFALAYALLVPAILQTVVRARRFAAEHPELATGESGTDGRTIQIGGLTPETMPDLEPFMSGMVIISLVTVLLLAAAVTRRLHDRDRRGWWGTIPLPFLITGLALMPRLFEEEPPQVQLFLSLLLNNILYLAALGGLIALLVGHGTSGPNRFGDPPPR